MSRRFYCKYCGQSFATLDSLHKQGCPRHPDGFYKGNHCLYQGAQKKEYVCKYCGESFPTLCALTADKCVKHPDGFLAGSHEAEE